MTNASQSRFDFTGSAPLQKLVKVLAKEQFKRASAELRIPVARSTVVLGVADPLGVLAPGEIHLCFSGVLEGGSAETLLNDVEVLVARHPALRRSDMQKVSTVPHRADAALLTVTGCSGVQAGAVEHT